jgi:hypothetical protein
MGLGEREREGGGGNAHRSAVYMRARWSVSEKSTRDAEFFRHLLDSEPHLVEKFSEFGLYLQKINIYF